MFKKITAILAAAFVVAACSDQPVTRAGTGAALGAGAAFAVLGSPVVGALAGGGIGYFTDKSTVDFGDTPWGGGGYGY